MTENPLTDVARAVRLQAKLMGVRLFEYGGTLNSGAVIMESPPGLCWSPSLYRTLTGSGRSIYVKWEDAIGVMSLGLVTQRQWNHERLTRRQ